MGMIGQSVVVCVGLEPAERFQNGCAPRVHATGLSKAAEGLAWAVAGLRDARGACHSALMRTACVLLEKGPKYSPLGPNTSTVDDVL